MRERINRLAIGIVDTSKPKVIWTPDAIEETIRTNTTVRRELFIGTEGGGSVQRQSPDLCGSRVLWRSEEPDRL